MLDQRYVVLDRDGVINVDSDEFIKSPDEWQALPGSLEAIAQLNKTGFKVVVVTNQSGVGRGLFDLATLNDIHAKMNRLLADKGGTISAIYSCPHTPDVNCDCRKPKPGLLHQFSREFQVSLKDMFIVGDSWRDLQSGFAVDAQPILVKTGKGLKTLAEHPETSVPVFEDLYAAVQYIVAS